MRLVQPDILLGIWPLRIFLPNSKACSLRKKPTSGGIVWIKLLFKRFSSTRKLKFPTCGDMEPPRLWDWRSSIVTLWCCRRPHETPCHRQNWILSFQELKTPNGSSILALKSSKANLSVSLPPPTTEVINEPKHHRKTKASIKRKDACGANERWKSPTNMAEERPLKAQKVACIYVYDRKFLAGIGGEI